MTNIRIYAEGELFLLYICKQGKWGLCSENTSIFRGGYQKATNSLFSSVLLKTIKDLTIK